MSTELERNAENIRILESIAEKLGNDMGARLIEVKACSSEFERLKTTCLAQEAEIARLQAGFDELRKMAFNLKKDLLRENHVEYDKGWKDCAASFYHEINRITGVKE